MAIYKVHIKTEGNKTVYTIYTTVFASIIYRADLGKYEVETEKSKLTADTADEADRMARESITAFLANLGVVPNFINE
ncbi:MAG: hypothetical protein HDT00_00310 [Bacteroidales bacterium]|nr:hypothetical protein [Bacteroidales bacterium]